MRALVLDEHETLGLPSEARPFFSAVDELIALGLEAAVAGMVGADALGDFLVQVLHERGIDAVGVLRDPSARTSATVALVDSSGEWTFLHVPGANGAAGEEQLDPEVVYARRASHFAGALVMKRLDGEPFPRIAEMRGATGAGDAFGAGSRRPKRPSRSSSPTTTGRSSQPRRWTALPPTRG